MLHEALIVLAGHQSPLVTRPPVTLLQDGLLHSSEKALLAQVAALGELNAGVMRRVQWIQQLHDYTTAEKQHEQDDNGLTKGPFPPSSHAVAAAVESQLIQPFRQVLVKLESDILAGDSSYVGGNRIVSLSTVVAETVHQYERRFRYSESLLKYVTTGALKHCHQIVARLERDAVTGYEDVKELATQCISFAQRTWLQQLSCWVLYGRLPQYSSGDFMITQHSTVYVLDENKIPPMCDEQLANDIYAIGNSLSQLQTDGADYEPRLRQIQLPIQRAQLSQVIKEIKMLVYRDVVEDKMPVEDISRFFDSLVEIPLLASADFGSVLFDSIPSTMVKPQDYFRQVVEAYIEDHHTDEDSDHLSRMFVLCPVKGTHQQAHADRFDDLLLGVRCKLMLELNWPFSILASESHRQRYSFVFSYLAALRKAHHQISSLWRLKKKANNSASRELWGMASKLKYCLDSLWDYAQSSVITSLYRDILVKELDRQRNDQEGIDPQQIFNQHSHFLSEVCRLLMVDSVEMRKVLRRLIISCSVLAQAVTVDGECDTAEITTVLSGLVHEIEAQPEICSKINLLLLKLEFVKI